jgi:energy-coupling factor transport system ATP-binding protein
MAHRRQALILVSLVAGLGFVLARVLYRVLFGGASSGETPLPSLEAVRLGGPFSHVTLFGPLTVEGLALAAVQALPFALVIVAVGVVVSFLDPRGLITLAPRLRWGSSVLLALGLAVSTFPSVIASATVARQASRLRGMRPGLRSLVAVLEITLERALGMAIALESRGLRGHKTPGSGESALAVHDFAVVGRIREPLRGEFAAGSRILVTGATGSGKTTLLEAAAGILSVRGDAATSGSLTCGSASDQLAYLPHSPHDLFLTSRVVDDVALGLIATGRTKVEARVLGLGELEKARLSHLGERDPLTLSSGEAALGALVVLLTTKPTLILLDEPLSALDASHRELFLGLLDRYCATSGASVVMTDHPRGGLVPDGFEPWQIGASGLRPGRYTADGRSLPERNPVSPPEPDLVLEVSDLTVTFGDRHVLDELSLQVLRGETLVIVGENGAGKSSLLVAIAGGTQTRVPGSTEHLSAATSNTRVKAVALVPSDPSTLFLCSSVGEELALADQIAGVPQGFSALTFESLQPGVLAGVLHTHPRDLSRGQQVCVAIALQMSHKPAVLLLDEPTRGLDEASEKAFAEVMGCVVETGTAVVVAAHHRDAGALTPSRVLTLDAGQVQTTPRQVIA